MILNLVLRKDKAVFLFLSSRTLLLNVVQKICIFNVHTHTHIHRVKYIYWRYNYTV